MSLVDKLTRHHKEEKEAIEDAPDTQKKRVSFERRIHSMHGLFALIADSPEKHKALALLHSFREAGEAALAVEDREASESEHKV